MLGHTLAGIAKDAIRIEVIAKPFKAGRVIRELCLEGPQRVAFHCGFAVIVGHLVPALMTQTLAGYIPTVKG
jgi:hypothetical protein